VVSSTIYVTEFQRYLKGVHYPANRAALLAQARSNAAPVNMMARLNELDENYSFSGVSEVMRGYVFYHYLRDATYPATRDQLLAYARSHKASRSLFVWLEAESSTITFATSTEAMQSFARSRIADAEIGVEMEQTAPSAQAMAQAEQEAAAPAPSCQRITTSIKITDFQKYLHGMRYPATRDQLLAQARANNAPPNMIARLEELDAAYRFSGVTEAMRGYIFYHYLRYATYPATRDQLLTEGRSRKATRSLVTWLESVSATSSFASATDAMQSYGRYKAGSEAEVEEEVEEVEAADVDTEATALATRSRRGSRRRITTEELQGYLRGVQYPAQRRQLLASARANHARRYVIVWVESIQETVTFVSFSEVSQRFTEYQGTHEEGDDEEDDGAMTPTAQAQVPPAAPAAQEEDEEVGDEEDDATTQGAGTPGVRRISPTAFRHHLRGIHYPADRAKLIEQARKNAAPENMIAILEELDATYVFNNAREVRLGYSYRRYLYGISYPITRAQLLERAHANKASSTLTRLLEGLNDSASFTSMGDVLKAAFKHS
jgi:hypothetical protein